MYTRLIKLIILGLVSSSLWAAPVPVVPAQTVIAGSVAPDHATVPAKKIKSTVKKLGSKKTDAKKVVSGVPVVNIPVTIPAKTLAVPETTVSGLVVKPVVPAETVASVSNTPVATQAKTLSTGPGPVPGSTIAQVKTTVSAPVVSAPAVSIESAKTIAPVSNILGTIQVKTLAEHETVVPAKIITPAVSSIPIKAVAPKTTVSVAPAKIAAATGIKLLTDTTVNKTRLLGATGASKCPYQKDDCGDNGTTCDPITDNVPQQWENTGTTYANMCAALSQEVGIICTTWGCCEWPSEPGDCCGNVTDCAAGYVCLPDSTCGPCIATNVTGCGTAADCCTGGNVCRFDNSCGIACLAPGATCSTASGAEPCCSNNCQAGVCACAPAGVAPHSANVALCCAGNSYLSTGFCNPLIANDGACGAATDCLSGICTSSKCACIPNESTCNGDYCCSGPCVDGICNGALVGETCVVNTDCSSQQCSSTYDAKNQEYIKTCTCITEAQSCAHSDDCCYGLNCISGQCSCVPVGTGPTSACQTSSQCCVSTTYAASDTAHANPIDMVAGCTAGYCTLLDACPAGLGTDLSAIHNYFIQNAGSLAPACVTSYSILVNNYTLLAQIMAMFAAGTYGHSCSEADYKTAMAALLNNFYSSLVVFQASCNLNTPFFATASVNTINNSYLSKVNSAAGITTNLTLSPTYVGLVASAGYPNALQMGFTSGTCPEGLSCTCEADLTSNNFYCFESPCCIGDINLDVNNNAATFASNVQNGISSVTGTALKAANDPALVNSIANNSYQSAFAADRFLSLVNCWLSDLPSNCKV